MQSIPYFRRLRKKNPTAEIHVLVEQCFADVAGFLPNIDRIITVRLEDLLPDLAHDRTGNISRAAAYYRGLIADLQAAKYSEVWNLTHTRPSMVMNYLLANKSGQGVTLDHNGLQRVNSPWLAYFFATNLARPWCSFNLVDIYANCVDGVPWDYGRSIRIDPEVYAQHVGVQLPLDEQRTRVAIHPGASQKDKQWPTEKYRAVAKLLAAHPGTDIVLIAGPADRKIAGQFADVSNLINLVGKTTPEELAGVLSQCSLLISNDSGPMHIAAAVGTPVLDITVGSALASETAPYGAGHMVVEPDSACFPCPPRRPCPASECAERISVETITE
ncbi:MAG: glycosyltransferase family 9 protein, partial [Calditrichota bacterium]